MTGSMPGSTPGEEGRWFATAKSLAYFELAAILAYKSPGNIETLNRAARDFVEKNPAFALNVAFTSLKWLAVGHFYELMGFDLYNSVCYVLDVSKRFPSANTIPGSYF